MRTQNMGNAKVQYPNEISFAFNPQKILFTRQFAPGMPVEKIVMSLFSYELPSNFTEEREVTEMLWYSPIFAQFDISRYLQLAKSFIVEKNGQRLITSFQYYCNITLYREGGGIMNFDFESTAIFGAINIGDVFNPSRQITWFRQFPFNVSVFLKSGTNQQYRIDGGQTQSIGGTPSTDIHVLNPATFGGTAQKSMQYIFGGVVNTFDFTFNYTFHQTSGTELFVDLEINDCTKGVYLRWLDKHGFYQYYLFEKATETLKNENNGDRIELDFTDGNEFYHGISTQNKNETKELKCATALTDRNTREMLKTIFSSPIVEMYIGEVGTNNLDYNSDNAFVSVIVTAGSYTPNGQDLQDFEVVISLVRQTQGF